MPNNEKAIHIIFLIITVGTWNALRVLKAFSSCVSYSILSRVSQFCLTLLSRFGGTAVADIGHSLDNSQYQLFISLVQTSNPRIPHRKDCFIFLVLNGRQGGYVFNRRQLVCLLAGLSRNYSGLLCSAPPRAHARDRLQQLRWLSVSISSRIQYKLGLCVLMFDIYNGAASSYKLEFCKRCTDSRLRCAAHGDFTIPRTRLLFTDISFTVSK